MYYGNLFRLLGPSLDTLPKFARLLAWHSRQYIPQTRFEMRTFLFKDPPFLGEYFKRISPVCRLELEKGLEKRLQWAAPWLTRGYQRRVDNGHISRGKSALVYWYRGSDEALVSLECILPNMLAPLANFFGSSLLSRKFLANKGMGMIRVEWSQSKFMINYHFLLSMREWGNAHQKKKLLHASALIFF